VLVARHWVAKALQRAVNAKVGLEGVSPRSHPQVGEQRWSDAGGGSNEGFKAEGVLERAGVVSPSANAGFLVQALRAAVAKQSVRHGLHR
jgi:hypothetical protein